MSEHSNEIVEFKSGDGLVSLRVALRDDDVWGTQAQIAELYAIDRGNTSRYLQSALESGEITKDSTRVDPTYVAADGKRRTVQLYNLDAIISVGYRARSPRAIEFRKWATRVLRGELTGRRITPAPVAPAVVPAFDLEALITRIVATIDERLTRLEAASGYIASYTPVHGVISARSHGELCSTRDVIVEIEAEISILQGGTDKVKAARVARSSVQGMIKRISRWGYRPGERLHHMPATYEAELFGALRERKLVGLKRLEQLKLARQQHLDFHDN